jgi:hypothetical protein
VREVGGRCGRRRAGDLRDIDGADHPLVLVHDERGCRATVLQGLAHRMGGKVPVYDQRKGAHGIADTGIAAEAIVHHELERGAGVTRRRALDRFVVGPAQ